MAEERSMMLAGGRAGVGGGPTSKTEYGTGDKDVSSLGIARSRGHTSLLWQEEDKTEPHSLTPEEQDTDNVIFQNGVISFATGIAHLSQGNQPAVISPGSNKSNGSQSPPVKPDFDMNLECIHADPPEGIDIRARNRLIIACLLCMVFMTGEIVGGLLSNSLAILSDGIHLLTDFASFMIAIAALHLAQRPASNKLNFGWHRIEIIGAFLSILLLWVLTGVLCYSAVLRVQSGDYELEPKIMLITAATGVFFNIVLATVLNEEMDQILGRGEDDEPDQERAIMHRDKGQKESCCELSLGESDSGASTAHSDDETALLESSEPAKARQRPGNINVKAAFIHVLGDLVQSLGILVAAYIVYFKPEYKIADPLCTFFFSFMVLLTTMTIMKDIIVVLMEAAPKDVDVPGMKTDLINVPGVVGLHSYRVWSLTLDKIAVSVHLSVAPSADPFKVLETATHIVRDLHFAHESFIQLERGPQAISAT